MTPGIRCPIGQSWPIIVCLRQRNIFVTKFRRSSNRHPGEAGGFGVFVTLCIICLKTLTHDRRLVTGLRYDILHQELGHFHLGTELDWLIAPLEQEFSRGLGD